jgi:hypothetical protein
MGRHSFRGRFRCRSQRRGGWPMAGCGSGGLSGSRWGAGCGWISPQGLQVVGAERLLTGVGHLGVLVLPGGCWALSVARGGAGFKKNSCLRFV